MVLRLAEHLEIPLRERNGLLLAAGYAPQYVERSLEEPEMAPIHQALDRFLRAHEPYPAVILDRHYNIVSANDATSVLTGGIAPDLVAPPANALRATLHPDGMAPRILNLPAWSAHLLHRLRRQVSLTADPELERLYDELSAYPGVTLEPPHDGRAADEIVLPLRISAGERELVFFSTISTFGTAVDITLAELMIEAFYRERRHRGLSPAGHRRSLTADARSRLEQAGDVPHAPSSPSLRRSPEAAATRVSCT